MVLMSDGNSEFGANVLRKTVFSGKNKNLGLLSIQTDALKSQNFTVHMRTYF